MTLELFLLRCEFTFDGPNHVHPYRWNAMVLWLNTRFALRDGIDFEAERREEMLEEIAMQRELDLRKLAYSYY